MEKKVSKAQAKKKVARKNDQIKKKVASKKKKVEERKKALVKKPIDIEQLRRLFPQLSGNLTAEKIWKS